MGIFDINLETYESRKSNSNRNEFEFKPDPTKGKDNVYRAKVRPVYWLTNPNGFNPKDNFRMLIWIWKSIEFV